MNDLNNLSQKFKITLQYLLPQYFLTWLMGKLANCKQTQFKNWGIRHFIKKYDINVEEVLESNLDHYPNFNTFFIRQLKPNLRPIVSGLDEIACPVDGSIHQHGIIQNGRIIQAKGFDFELIELIGGFNEDASHFMNGEFITLYLSPKDYHRVHMPITGTLYKMIYIPGRLFSVNTMMANHIPRLFSRNERVVCLFNTEIGPMAVILVGAMLVGSIHMNWHGGVNSSHGNSIQAWDYSPSKHTFNRGDELGYFKFGSTVIVLFGPEKINWSSQIQASAAIKYGELLAKIMHDQTKTPVQAGNPWLSAANKFSS